MKIGLIVAMDEEFNVIAQAWLPKSPANRAEREINKCRVIHLTPSEGNEVVLLCGGVGKVNAAMATMMLAAEKVDCIISSGVAGGTSPILNIGKVVVGVSYQYHDVYCGKEVCKGQVQDEPFYYYADVKLLQIASKLAIENAVLGSIVTGDQCVDTKRQMGAILDDFPNAAAVDMESCAMAHVCHTLSVPFISFRMLSDVVLNPLSKNYREFWQKAPLQMASNTMRYVMKVLKEYTPF